MSFHRSEVISNACSFECGFHRADWEIIRRWIDTNVSSAELDQAWNDAVVTWVNKIRDDLGGGYFVVESRQTILLSDLSRETAEWLLEYAGRAAVTIKEQLGDAAWPGEYGKDVILIFSDDDDVLPVHLISFAGWRTGGKRWRLYPFRIHAHSNSLA
jgi:hypothetical protein